MNQQTFLCQTTVRGIIVKPNSFALPLEVNNVHLVKLSDESLIVIMCTLLQFSQLIRDAIADIALPNQTPSHPHVSIGFSFSY